MTYNKRFLKNCLLALLLTFIVAVLFACNASGHFIYFHSKGGSDCAPLQTKGKEMLSLPVPERNGYEFEGWFYDDGIFYSALKENSLEKTKLKEDINLYAKWKKIDTATPIVPDEPTPVDVSIYPYPAYTAASGNVHNIQYISTSVSKPAVASMMDNAVSRWLFTLSAFSNPQTEMTYNGISNSDIANNLKKGKNLFVFTKNLGLDTYTYTFEIYLIEGSIHENIEYAFYEDRAVILKINAENALAIPSEIQNKTVSYLAPLSVTSNTIKEISIPKDLTFIAEEALSRSTGISNIRVHSDNSFYKSVEGSLYNKEQTALVKYAGEETFTCPADLIEIMPYAFYGSIASEVTLSSKTVYLGGRAFFGAEKLQKVNGLQAIKVISKELFAQSALSEINLTGVVSILDKAFSQTKITSAIIPEGIEYMGEHIFEYCALLENITTAKSQTKIPEGFAYQSGLTSLCAENILEINDYAFYGCDALTEVTLGENLLTIGEFAFTDCTKLASILFPESLTTIGQKAFMNTSLTKVELPKNLITLETSVFSSISTLEEVELNDELVVIKSSAFSKSSLLSSLDIPASVREIGNGAFYSSGLKYVYIPVNVVTLAKDAFGDIAGLVAYIGHNERPSGWNEDWTNSSTPKYWAIDTIGSNEDYNYYEKDGEFSVITKYVGSSEHLIIPAVLGSSPVAEIGEYAFSNTAAQINSVRFASDAYFKIIQSYAFSQSTVKEIYLPKSIETIGERAFSESKRLERVEFLALQAEDNPRLTSIGKYAFENCSALSYLRQTAFDGEYTIGIPVSVTEIAEGTFTKTNLSVFYVHKELLTIGEAAFKQCGNLGSVIFEEESSLTAIGTAAFMQSNLSEIEIPKNVTVISENTFYWCKNLTSVTFLGKITEIGTEAFSYCSNLSNIDMPSSLVTIKSKAFIYCSALTSLVFGNNLKTIGKQAFSNCVGLETVYISLSVETIGESAFGSSGSGSITCEATDKPAGFIDGWNGKMEVKWKEQT